MIRCLKYIFKSYNWAALDLEINICKLRIKMLGSTSIVRAGGETKAFHHYDSVSFFGLM
jgi:hypothetical protein